MNLEQSALHSVIGWYIPSGFAVLMQLSIILFKHHLTVFYELLFLMLVGLLLLTLKQLYVYILGYLV